MGYHSLIGTLSKLSEMSSSPDIEVCSNVFLYMPIDICDKIFRILQSVGLQFVSSILEPSLENLQICIKLRLDKSIDFCNILCGG